MVLVFDWLLFLCIVGHMTFLLPGYGYGYFWEIFNFRIFGIWEFCLLFHYVLNNFFVLGLDFFDPLGFELGT